MNPLSGVLSEAWRLYKANAFHLMAIAFVVYVAAAVVAAVLTLALGLLGVLLALIINVVAAYLVQAALVKSVQDVRDGRADLSVGQTLSAAVGSIGPVAGASILAGIAIVIGLLLVIVPGLYLITIWAVIVPVIVIERAGVLASFGRSRGLVRGHGWQVFGTLVVAFLIWLAATLVIGVILTVLPSALRSAISNIVAGTVVTPFIAVVVTLIYYRLVGARAPSQPVSYGVPPHGGYGAPPDGYGTPPGGGYGTPPSGGYGTPPGGYGPA